jgi:hypothetical protein
VWREFSTIEKRAENGYPEEEIYAVQDKAWIDEKWFLDWNTRVWTPFTQRPRASVHSSLMIMEEFKFHFMGSCLNAIQNTGTEVEFVVGGCNGCVQILNTSINHTFKAYDREEFQNLMFTNLSFRHPTWGEVASWVNTAWKKSTEDKIKNTWKYVGHFVPGEFGDPSLEPASYNDDDTIDNNDKIMEYQEKFALAGSNLLDVEEEGPLYVMELTPEEIARARRFPNGNGECDVACHGNITAV